MATAVKRTARARQPARDSAAEVHAAVLQLLKAIPVDHLDKRVTALEQWAARVQKDLERLVADLGRPAAPRAHRPAAAAVRSARHVPLRSAPVRRRIPHLPVESEIARPGG